ncbi:hypothetical protein YC2023_115005 [Brassica napus]
MARNTMKIFTNKKMTEETLTPKKLLILALQEAERNGNNIYIICLYLMCSPKYKVVKLTFSLSGRYAIHVPSIYYASVVALITGTILTASLHQKSNVPPICETKQPILRK